MSQAVFKHFLRLLLVIKLESIKPIATSEHSYARRMIFDGTKIQVKFRGSCLKQEKVSINHKSIINLYIAYKINLWSSDNLCSLCSDFILGNPLFTAVKLTENADSDKYFYFRYVTGFNGRSVFSLSRGDGFGENVIIFRVDNSSSPHADNRRKDILILGKIPTDGLDDITKTAEVEYFITFTELEHKYRLSLHCNRSNSYLFVNRVEIY